MPMPWEKDPVVGTAPWERDQVVGAPAPAASPSPTNTAEKTDFGSPDPAREGFFAPFADPDRTARNLQIGTQGVGKGVANTAAAPFALSSMLFNIPIAAADFVSTRVGGPSLPFRFPMNQGDVLAEASTNVFENLGVDVIKSEEMTPTERLGSTINDFATQALIGGSTLAARAPAVSERLAGGTSRMFDDAFRPYFDKPGTALVGDTAAGVGSGAMVHAVDENTENGVTTIAGLPVPEYVAAPVAALAGGVGGGTAAQLTRGGASAARSAFDNLVPDRAAGVDPNTLAPPSRRTVETAARVMQDAARDPETGAPKAQAAAANIGERAAEFRDAGLPVPSSALLSDNVGLQMQESAGRTTDPAPFIKRDNQLRAAATDRVQSVRDPGADQSAVGRRAAAARDEALAPAQLDETISATASRAADDARGREAAPVAAARSSSRRADASRALDRAVVDETYLPARADKNARYDAEGAGTTVDMTEVASTARQIRDQAEALPESARNRIVRADLLNDLADIDNMSFEAASRLRMQLSDDITAAREAKQFTLADGLQELRFSIGQALDAQAPGAARNYREDFAPRFRPGPGDEGAKFTRDIDRDPTRSRTPPEKTAGRFLAAPEKAAALRRILADQPTEEAGVRAVGDYMMSDFATVVLGPDGNIVPRRARAWLDANAAALDEFPEVRAQMETLADASTRSEASARRAAENLTAARDRLRLTEREIDRSIVGTLLNEDPRDVARSLFSTNRRAVEEDFRRIGEMVRNDPAAARGWKAAVADTLADMVSGTTKLSDDQAFTGETFRVELGKIDALFKKHRDAMALVFSPEEMNRLQQAQALLEPLKNATLKATAGSNTADKLAQILKPVEVAARLRYGHLKGGSIMRSVRIALSSLPTNEKAVAALLRRARFDPDLAQYLLTARVRDLDEAASSKWVRRLLAAGAYGRADKPEDSDEE